MGICVDSKPVCECRMQISRHINIFYSPTAKIIVRASSLFTARCDEEKTPAVGEGISSASTACDLFVCASSRLCENHGVSISAFRYNTASFFS